MSAIKQPDWLAQIEAEEAALRAERNTLPARVQARIDALAPHLGDRDRERRDQLVAEWRRVHRTDERNLALGALTEFLYCRERQLARERAARTKQPTPQQANRDAESPPPAPIAAPAEGSTNIPPKVHAAIVAALTKRGVAATAEAVAAMWKKMKGAAQ